MYDFHASVCDVTWIERGRERISCFHFVSWIVSLVSWRDGTERCVIGMTKWEVSTECYVVNKRRLGYKQN